MEQFSDVVIKKKKMLILICGVIIFFLTSMAKVIIPSTIFQDLLKMGMSVDKISSLGAAFLYSYAASQLLMGCFSDRYGGVRILLIGGSLFAGGTILFPLMKHYPLMILFRIITGFGAGTIFLGVAKLLGDLFSKRFGFALGAVLFFGYLGPTTGTVPMVKLVEAIGWRNAMILPGAVALLPMLLIVAMMKGTIKPVTGGQTFTPLFCMLKSRSMWFLCFSCASVYGAYYAIVGQIGQKTLTDLFSLSSGRAATCIMILTLIVAVNNMGGNLMLKLFHERRKMVLLCGVTLSLLGIIIAMYGFSAGKGITFFLTSMVMLAFPAGYFPMFSIVAKEINPPEYIAMSVAFLNFMAFVFISLYQNITGCILHAFPPETGTLAFSQAAYAAVYLFFLIGAVISLIAVCFVPETRNSR